jgi:pyruvate formate lyase activating enzyme
MSKKIFAKKTKIIGPGISEVVTCAICGKEPAARVIGACPECLRSLPAGQVSLASHQSSREKFGLPGVLPRQSAGAKCRLCANECQPGREETGYCGLRKNVAGRMNPISPPKTALVHIYLDALPTNCCAAWFCEGSRERGYNLAVFFYGCNFDCLFCQNHSHKLLDKAPLLTEEKILSAALLPEVRCVCFFGGSPEPQLPFALRVSRRILKESRAKKHICWEWNGCGEPGLVKKAAELAFESKGTVKFDLKCFEPQISLALCGVDNRRAYENFSLLSRLFPKKDLLTATTLLVPYYVDAREVKEIARFISKLGQNIPYSLLVFHPDYLMTDLPPTPRDQVDACYKEACRHLSRVNIGNLNLL